MKILVTGVAGFIGFHTAKNLLERGDEVIGLDNINSYYDVKLKYNRLMEMGIQPEVASQLTSEFSTSNNSTEVPSYDFGKLYQSDIFPLYRFIRLNLEDKDNIIKLFKTENFEKVIHLAAQAGVRYSIDNPWSYIDCNITGHLSILEACRYHKVEHLVYASSSSVYGNNKKYPLSTNDNVDHPISLYAATKKANELMSHTYSHLYKIPTTGLRFFTVYGPWGRPDMALFIFTKAISENRDFEVYNNGDMWRDFTYIDDIVEGIVKILDQPPKDNFKKTETLSNSRRTKISLAKSATAPFAIYNIGCSNTVKLLDFIREIEKNLDKKAKIKFSPIQPGDVEKTLADVTDLDNDIGYKPSTKIQVGVKKFVEWYKEYYLTKPIQT